MTVAVKRVGVIGLGTMGAGIAQVCIQAGVPTVACESTADLAERGRASIDRQLARAVEKGKLSADEKASTLELLRPTDDLAELADCELVIEAVFESLEVKHELFRRLEQAVNGDAVLATNTSALSVTEIAAVLERPESVAGM